MKKLILLFTIICAGQLYGMEPEKLTPTEATENPYKQLPKELQQEIVNAALASSTDLGDAINAIEKLSVLHTVSLNKDVLIRALMKKFPEKIKEEIVFAVDRPDEYQEVDTLLRKDDYIFRTIKIIKQKNLLQNNFKDFTILVHILADKSNRAMPLIAGAFISNENATSIASDYLNNSTYVTSHIGDDNSDEDMAWRVEKEADVNFINQYDETPLSEAIRINRYNIVKLLLDNGANPNFKNPGNMTPSQYMESVGASQEIKDLIQDAIKKW